MALVDSFSFGGLDIEFHVETSAAADNPRTQINLPNRPDWQILGGSAQVMPQAPGTAEHFLTSMYPVTTREWEVAAQRHVDALSQSPVAVQGFCVAARIPATEYQMQIATSNNPTSHPDVTATLRPGFILVGGGARANPQQVPGPGSFLTASRPGTGQSWYTAAKDHLRRHQTDVTAYAFGISEAFLNHLGLKVVRLLATSETPESRPFISSSEVVSDGFVVTAGAEVHWKGLGNLLVGLWPRPAPQVAPQIGPHSRMWTAFGSEFGGPDPSLISTMGLALVSYP